MKLVTLFVLAFASMAPGCVTVHPWQRERLARPSMQLDPPASTKSYTLHVRAVRLGDVYPGSAGGGGCGCN